MATSDPSRSFRAPQRGSSSPFASRHQASTTSNGKGSPWQRAEKIALTGVIIAGLTLIAAWLVVPFDRPNPPTSKRIPDASSDGIPIELGSVIKTAEVPVEAVTRQEGAAETHGVGKLVSDDPPPPPQSIAGFRWHFEGCVTKWGVLTCTLFLENPLREDREITMHRAMAIDQRGIDLDSAEIAFGSERREARLRMMFIKKTIPALSRLRAQAHFSTDGNTERLDLLRVFFIDNENTTVFVEVRDVQVQR